MPTSTSSAQITGYNYVISIDHASAESGSYQLQGSYIFLVLALELKASK